MNDNISVILSDNLNNHIPLLINILEVYGIKQQKRIYMQSFIFHSSYYLNHLISLISKIDFKLVKSYMFPIGSKRKILTKEPINYNKFLLALEKIRKSNIVISSNKVFNEDWLNYIFEKNPIEPYDVIIIDDFNKLLQKSHKDIKTIKETIEQYSKKHNTHIILFTKDNVLKNNFNNWKIAKVNDPLAFVFNHNNYNLIDIN